MTAERPHDPGPPVRQVRAAFTTTHITVYQAYRPEIAVPAIATGRFVPPFKRDRMTWIKPSLLWMAYRSGWATKPGQERVLAIEITRDGFEWALAHSCLTHYESRTHASHDAWTTQLRNSPVRIQWDPERDLRGEPLPHRAIQIGLSGQAVDRYVDEWVADITDITALMQDCRRIADAGDTDEALRRLPTENPYPLDPSLAAHIGM